MKRKNIVEQARTWLGTPFHHQGRIKGIGVDCVGFLIGLAKELGVDPPDLQSYSRNPQNGQLTKILHDNLTPVDTSETQIGDILVFRIYKEPQHVALKTDKGIIHAVNGIGVVETSLDGQWTSRLVEAYKMPEVN